MPFQQQFINKETKPLMLKIDKRRLQRGRGGIRFPALTIV